MLIVKRGIPPVFILRSRRVIEKLTPFKLRINLKKKKVIFSISLVLLEVT